MNLIIIDSGKVCFNGNTLNVRGLGGSESAIILLSKELVKIGFNVTVLNTCKSNTCIPGTFDNVTYIDKSDIGNIHDNFDIVISSRSVLPFISNYSFISSNSYKIVWLHDTFCEGDEYLEELVLNHTIDEIFTLSDFHTNYISNANHHTRRMFEVLKNKIFQTRNGAKKYKESDVTSKSKYHFVYNSSVSKGLVTLLDDIWPEIKKNIPFAKLIVIGGYYNFADGVLDEQGELYNNILKNKNYILNGVIFTDIITPYKVAEHLKHARFMLYPSVFPETFGISSLESLLYKTPIITCRFGALEETALEKACYLLDYPIEPNNLYPNINKESQVKAFIELVMKAYNDEYLYKQKQEYCSIIEDVYGWDTIALQWKQHLFHKLGYFLSKEEYQKVTKINNDVSRIFSRRNKNLVELAQYPKYNKSEKPISIITPVYNSQDYIERCIESVITQDYNNYTLYIIDDNSTDNTKEIIKSFLPNDKIKLLENSENKGALYNQVNTISTYCSDEDIIILLDGDDCLINNNSILNYYNELHDNYDFSYGSCWSEVDNIPLIAQEYPSEIINTKQYKTHLFAWNIPYTHLRTFKKILLNNVNIENLQNNGEWLKAGGDVALFYELIYQVEGNRIKAVKDIMAYYNDKNVLNDYKINSEEQTNNVQNILSKKDLAPVIRDMEAKFSVIIPTMWKYKPLCKFLEKLVDVELVEEIIIINNDSNNTPNENILNHEKIKLHNFSENIFVNPAWNYGVSQALNNKLAIINDDIEYDLKVFEKVYPYVIPENGATGISYKDHTNMDITITATQQELLGFGSLFFIHKSNWINIPQELKVYCGDNLVFDVNIIKGKPNYLITDIDFYTPIAATTRYITNGEILCEGLESETEIYRNLILNYEHNYNRNKIKTILIAIPTDKYISPETFKSIYDLEIPTNYKIEFQYFYGYRIDQVRNLIADWGKKYDYLFAVDSDITFPKETLKRLLNANQDIISGLYIQRIEHTHELELYGEQGRIKYEDIKGKGVIEVEGCGFGCVLVNSRVLKKMEYPHFLYTHAIDHNETYSEDYYFCSKAKSLGFKIFADTSILCKHIGEINFLVE